MLFIAVKIEGVTTGHALGGAVMRCIQLGSGLGWVQRFVQFFSQAKLHHIPCRDFVSPCFRILRIASDLLPATNYFEDTETSKLYFASAFKRVRDSLDDVIYDLLGFFH